MKIKPISIVFTLLFFSNIIVGTGNYFNEEIAEDLYTNLSGNLSYGGNMSTYDYDNESFETIAEQLKQNPTITSIGETFSTLRSIFFGLPEFIYEIMGKAQYPHKLNASIRLGLEAMMSLVYIVFILQMISYLMGGGE